MQGIYARSLLRRQRHRTPAITGTGRHPALHPRLRRCSSTRSISRASPSPPTSASSPQTPSLAILLHRKKLASLTHLEYAELGRSLLAALIAYAATYWTVHQTTNLLHLHRGHPTDLISIAIGTTTWAILATATLLATRSHPPQPTTPPQTLTPLPNHLMYKGEHGSEVFRFDRPSITVT